MTQHKYKPEDRVILKDGRTGTIESTELSWKDGEIIPSYWIKFPRSIFPDRSNRNIHESSIAGIAPVQRTLFRRILNLK